VLAKSPDYWYSGCGDIHYPPNGVSDYDYRNPSTVFTTCYDFANYPNLGDPQVTALPVTCSAWNCYEVGFMGWWHSHLPANPGCGPDNVANNWWNYFVEPAHAHQPLAACAPTRLTITGPDTGKIGATLHFIASLQAVTATRPITFSWQATGQAPVTHTAGDLLDAVSYTWMAPGAKAITVSATYANGQVVNNYSAVIQAPGDCNGNGAVTAFDLTALAYEFFDGDDNHNPATAPGGTFPGTPACDANQDGYIAAGDGNCIARIFFAGPGACSVMAGAATAGHPALSIAGQIPATAGGQAIVPVRLQANGSQVSSLFFSLDYDERWLSFDPADGNGDGIPDAVTFHAPPSSVRLVMVDQGDTDGELDIMLASFASAPAALQDGVLLTVTLDVGQVTATTEAAVNFSQQPAISWSDVQGRDVAGMVDHGAVLISVVPDAPAQSTIYLPLIVQER
jgi:hypothetical protein